LPKRLIFNGGKRCSGRRLFDEIHRLIADVCAAPRLFRVVEKPLRRHSSESFPYAILYVELPEHIAIYAAPTANAAPFTRASACTDDRRLNLPVAAKNATSPP